MKKAYIAVVFIFSISILSACGRQSDTVSHQSDEESQRVFSETMDVSRQYLYLHYLTERVLTEPATYADYDAWSADMIDLQEKWLSFELMAASLEKKAEEYSESKTSFRLIPYAVAISTQEINDVFDRAPAGKKIKTLASHLGVDAKRAALILKQAQDETEAEAWNEAGDTFQKLETTAVVIKDGCKVAGFVGGVILSGGTAGLAAASTASKAAIIVTGADLVLEVSEDSAKIALGNSNKISEFIGDARVFTEPLATILTITSLHENLASGMDKFNAVMLALDQFRTSAQEGKIVGIALPGAGPGKKDKISASGMTEEEIEDWLGSLGIKKTDEGYVEIMEGIAKTIEKSDEVNVSGDSKKEEAVPAIEAMGDASQSSESPVEVSGEAAEIKNSDVVGNAFVYGKDGKVKAVFSGPAEDTFMPRQARGWKVDIDGFDNLNGAASYACDFIFYLNGVKYQEMLENRGCGFTNTFIEEEGDLKVDVTIKFLKGRSVFNDDGSYKEYVRDVYDTIVLSRDFVVAKPVRK